MDMLLFIMRYKAFGCDNHNHVAHTNFVYETPKILTCINKKITCNKTKYSRLRLYDYKYNAI